jgi:hypothetical protein
VRSAGAGALCPVGAVCFLVLAGLQLGCAPAESSQALTQEELERTVERLLPATAELSGLEERRTPRVAIRSRSTLERYLREQIARDLPPERASALTAVYARLGLVPDTLQLAALLEALLLEQIVGYYDPATDTLYVVDRVHPDSVEIVLVHELVHALQDQHSDMDSLLRALEADNDRSTAARAAIEGHATFVMTEWQLEQMSGRHVDLSALPSLAEIGQGLDLAGLPGMDRLGSAPRFVRESLLFPYLGGLGFMQGYWAARTDRPVPIGGHLPQSSEQILHPERSFGPDLDEPTRLVFVTATPEGWEEVHADGLGEFEIRILLEELLGDRAAAEREAAGWDGDRYRLLSRGDEEVLMWTSVWDAPADATEFEAAVSRALRARYGDDPGREGPGAGATADAGLYGPLGAEKRWISVRTTRLAARPAVVVVDFALSDPDADPAAEAEWWLEAARVREEQP